MLFQCSYVLEPFVERIMRVNNNVSRRNMLRYGAFAAASVVASSTMIGCSSYDTNANDASNTKVRVSAYEPSSNLDEAVEGSKIEVVSDLPEIGYYPNVIYKAGFDSGKWLCMDIIQPSTKDPLPCVVFLNGGAFIRSDPSKHLYMRMKIAEAGYVVASVQYSVAPLVRFPRPLMDCKDAVRFLRANAAEYNIDKERIAAIGESAGGYYATMLGVTSGIADFDSNEVFPNESCDVAAVVDLYGLSDLSITGEGLQGVYKQSHEDSSSMEALLINGISFYGDLGQSIAESKDAVIRSSPFTYIGSGDPPFLILHGAKDTVVSPVASKELELKLQQEGVEVTRYILPNAGHGTTEFNQPEVLDVIIGFLNAHLKA